MNHPFSQESSLWPSGKWDSVGIVTPRFIPRAESGLETQKSAEWRLARTPWQLCLDSHPREESTEWGGLNGSLGVATLVFVHLTCGQGNLAAEEAGPAVSSRRVGWWSEHGCLSHTSLGHTQPFLTALVGPSWSGSGDITCLVTPLEKEMATHSSVLAWRIPGTEEPSRLPSMGSHRVGHDWSDLGAAAAATPPPHIRRPCFANHTLALEAEKLRTTPTAVPRGGRGPRYFSLHSLPLKCSKTNQKKAQLVWFSFALQMATKEVFYFFPFPFFKNCVEWFFKLSSVLQFKKFQVPFVETWMDLETVIQTEISQKEKNK